VKHLTSITSKTLRRPPAAAWRGGKAEDARSISCRMGMRDEGRGALEKMPFSAPQNESSPQLEEIGDSEVIS